jgi:hypothetical protein
MDRCLDDLVGVVPTLPLPVLLNVVACAISMAAWAVVWWWDRPGAPPPQQKDPARAHYSLSFGALTQYLSLMAIYLGLPVIFVFYASPSESELSCQASVLNNLGVVPWSLITTAFPVLLLLAEASRRSPCGRHALAGNVAAALDSCGAFSGAHRSSGVGDGAARVLVLPSSGRGLFVGPLVRALVHRLARGADAGAAPALHLTAADAWGTEWQPDGPEWLAHNLRAEGIAVVADGVGESGAAEGGGADDEPPTVRLASTDFFTTLPAQPSSLDAIIVPYAPALAAVRDGEGGPGGRGERLLLHLTLCAAALRPGGVLAAGVLSGSEAATWLQAMEAAGLVGATRHKGAAWLSPVPTVVVTARRSGGGAPGDGGEEAAAAAVAAALAVSAQGLGRRDGGPAATTLSPPSALSPAPARPARPWFPSGAQWRARDCAVGLTWAAAALLTWVSCAYLEPLLVPTYVTWGSTIGTLALSSALFGPSCVYYLAVELTKYADGEIGGAGWGGESEGKEVGGEEADPDGDAAEALLLASSSESSRAERRRPERTAADVWRRWVAFELLILAANLGGFQLVFWLPGFAADALMLRFSAGSTAADADNASAATSYALLAVAVVAAWAWVARSGRRDAAAVAAALRGSSYNVVVK